MIYAPISTPAQLLAALPHLLDTLEEAADLLDQFKEEMKPRGFRTTESDIHLDEFEENAHTYSSVSEAFYELYDGSIDEFKRTTCEDYGACISDFGDYYADWLDSNFSVYYIGKKKLIITD
jgi:hypothetical protein